MSVLCVHTDVSSLIGFVLWTCLCLPGKGEDTYPDLLALFICLLVTVIIALGVQNSVGFNNVLNVVNLVVWVFMIIAGLFFLSTSNWEGGRFLPYGWSGVRSKTAWTPFRLGLDEGRIYLTQQGRQSFSRSL